MINLKSIEIEGFKSIKSMKLEFKDLNVMIGANGAGKSNFISFFKMLNEMMGSRLQQYIGISGRAQTLLHFGPKTTSQIQANLEFEADIGTINYYMRLFHAAGDSLIYAEEKVSFKRFNPDRLVETQLGAGHQETLINEAARNNDKNALALRAILTKCRVFHFHDTSLTARIRQYCYIGDSRFLMPDAGNLAAYLYRLFNESPSIYQLIVKNIRLIAPFFHDFDLAPDGLNKNDIILNWRQAESSALFGPHQFSDGTLRAISLISLLLMPKEELPELIVVDEPELGLHPYALNVIAGLFRSASINTQILISTQSSTFLDNFETEDVIVVDRDLKESTFRRLEREELNEWLEEYSLGEVWEKNVIGGGPQ